MPHVGYQGGKGRLFVKEKAKAVLFVLCQNKNCL
jgi:hypothetical protein